MDCSWTIAFVIEHCVIMRMHNSRSIHSFVVVNNYRKLYLTNLPDPYRIFIFLENILAFKTMIFAFGVKNRKALLLYSMGLQ